MDRRDFLKYGGAGAASAALGLWPGLAIAQTSCPPGSGTPTFSLEILTGTVQMVDGTRVNMLGFSGVPGPVLRVLEGSQVRIAIANRRPEAHGFEIPDVAGSRITIPAGCSATVSFTAPVAGTYLYQDASQGPLYRILGLHGVMVVEPLNGTTPAGSRTPYSLDRLDPDQRRAITTLFDALGTTPRFPGGKWVPCPLDLEYSGQEKIWVVSEVDPKFNALVVPDRPVQLGPLTQNVVANFVPRYFTINSRSGYDLHEGDDVVFKNYVGEPSLVRVVNAGLAHHYNHFHGNDLMSLSGVEFDVTSPNFGKVVVSGNIFELDTHAVWPTERRDLLLPYEVPHDIPFRAPGATQSQFDRMVAGTAQEPFPLRYVMHCHCEMSQTAGGGNYPQGLVTHWELLGGLGGRAAAGNVVGAGAPSGTPPSTGSTPRVIPANTGSRGRSRGRGRSGG